MDKKIILIVDDVEMNRAILSATFQEEYDILEAVNGREALDVIELHKDKISAVLLDVIMPVMDGFEVLEEMNRKGWIEKIPVFLITAESSQQVMKKGYELGVVDIIGKPITPFFIRRRIGNVIKLNNVVNEQEAMLKKQEKEIRELNRSILETLSTAIEFRDCESGEHVVRMSNLTLLFLKAIYEYYPEYGVEESELQVIADAAVMHDVGKIAIPDNILNKPGRLTLEEFEIMKTHSLRGCELLDSVPKMRENPIYEYAYDICRHHHERWDGKGYPDGLKGEEISIWAQVVALADVYDALVSERVYKKAYSHDVAIHMILEGECGTFNPILMECLKKVEKQVRESYEDKN
ncbi:MAG: response regulator [Eubacteriales bacterium]|nr:response regulator [Eubacteriales bacterium]